MKPAISVIMSVYNDMPFLPEAVESILNQSFSDFEFIIINDGSTDGSKECLEKYVAQDDRIILVDQENIGLTKSLNKGIALAKSKYIARMDGDDISTPNRFERQVKFLDKSGSVVVSSNMELIDSSGNEIGYHDYPTSPQKIKFAMAFYNPISHPAVMINSHKLCDGELYYDESYETCQDYELWSTLSKKYSFGNLPERLLKYRRHPNAVGVTKSSKQRSSIRKIRENTLRFYFSEASDLDLSVFFSENPKLCNPKLFKDLFIQLSNRCDVDFHSPFVQDLYIQSLLGLPVNYCLSDFSTLKKVFFRKIKNRLK